MCTQGGLQTHNSTNKSTSCPSQKTADICILKNMPLASMTTLETCKYYTLSKIHTSESKLLAVWDARQFSLLFDIFLSSLAFQAKRKLVALSQFLLLRCPKGNYATDSCKNLPSELCSETFNGFFFFLTKSPNPWGLVPMNFSTLPYFLWHPPIYQYLMFQLIYL